MNYASLSNAELVRIWHADRNGMSAVMAANEIMNRLDRGDYTMVDTDEYNQLVEDAS